MKVIFINRAIGMFRGGGETYALNIARGLRELGCEIRFILPKPWFGEVKYPIDDFETEYVASPYLRDLAQRMAAGNSYFEKISVKPLQGFSQKGCRFIAGAIFKFYDLKSQNDIFDHLRKRDKDYDIVQVFSHCVLASRIVEELRIPVVIRFPGPPRIAYKKHILRCNAVVANGDAFLQTRDSITSDVIDIPPGIDSEKFKTVDSNIRNKYNIEPDDTLVLFVGRFVPLKNLPFLINGMAEVIKSNNKVKLMLVGEGPLYSQTVKLVCKLNIKDNALLTGRIPNSILPEYYSAADVFVITSNYDNFPNAVIEAMACGLPVVATKVGGIPQQVEHGVNGFLIQNNNIAELKESILKLVGNRTLCKEIGQRNREMVISKYNWSKSTRKFLEIYEHILGQKS